MLLHLSVVWLAAAPTHSIGASGQLHLVRRDGAQAAAAQRARQMRLHGLGMELEQAGTPYLVRHADTRSLESHGPEARADAGQLQALMSPGRVTGCQARRPADKQQNRIDDHADLALRAPGRPCPHVGCSRLHLRRWRGQLLRGQRRASSKPVSKAPSTNGWPHGPRSRSTMPRQPPSSTTPRWRPGRCKPWHNAVRAEGRREAASEERFTKYMAQWRQHIYDLAADIRKRGETD